MQRPHPTTDRSRPICPACAHADALYRAATAGDAQAEDTLYRLARRAAVRLLAERRHYRHDRAIVRAAQRDHRARTGTGPVPPQFLLRSWVTARQSGVGAHHIHARRDAERALVRDHPAHLRHLIRSRCTRLRDLAHTCLRPQRNRPPPRTAADSQPGVYPPAARRRVTAGTAGSSGLARAASSASRKASSLRSFSTFSPNTSLT